MINIYFSKNESSAAIILDLIFVNIPHRVMLKKLIGIDLN